MQDCERRDSRHGRTMGRAPVPSWRKERAELTSESHTENINSGFVKIKETILSQHIPQVCEMNRVSLNKHENWNIVKDLKEHALKITKLRERSPYKDEHFVQYEIPVIDEKYVKINASQQVVKPKHTFIWNNVKYDDRLIYYRQPQSNTFTPFGQFKWNRPDKTKRLKAKIKVVGSDAHLHSIHLLTTEGGYTRTEPECSNLKDNVHLLLDLGKDTVVSHISFMGRVLHLGRFPDIFSSSADRKTFPKGRSIVYTEDKTDVFVTKFQILARQHAQKEWTNLGEVAGNKDRLTEVTHPLDIGVPIQFIKIVPLCWSKQADFQISLFGPDNIYVEENELEEKQETLLCSVFLPGERKYTYEKCGRFNNFGDPREHDKRLLRKKEAKKAAKCVGDQD